MKRVFVLLSALLFLNACASVSTLQTARVLEKGESQHSLGVAMYNSDDFIGGDDLSFPFVEYTYRRSWFNDWDFGVKLAIIGSLVLDAKYNLINADKFALATGLGVGYLSFTSSVGDVESESTIIDLIVPLYLSYDVSKMFSVYGAGKYILRSISADGMVDAEDGSLASATAGVKWGEEAGVFIEGSLITGLDNDFSGSQFNGSYFFSF